MKPILPIYKCPHCRELGFSARAKLFGSVLLPACCTYCGKAASIKTTFMGSLLAELFDILLLVTLITAVLLGDWRSLIVIVTYILLAALFLKLVPLKPISDTLSSRHYSLFIILLALASIGVVASLLTK